MLAEAIVAAIAALITGTCAIIAQIIIANRANADLYNKLERQSELADKQLDAKLEKHQAVTDLKIEELTREVRKHNNFAERIPTLEAKVENLERQSN